MSDPRPSIVELIFKGVDNVSPAVTSVLSATKDLSGNLQKATGPMAGFSGSLLDAQKAIIGTGAAITAFSLGAAGEFDTAFREISTLIGRPVEELGEFRQAILDYGKTSLLSLSDITAAMYNTISAGVDYTDSLGMIAQAEKLAVAGKASLDQAVNLLIPTMTAYGAGMEDAERYSDTFFNTVREGRTTIPELADSFGSFANSAALLDIPIETIAAAFAQITTLAPNSAAAATQLDNILTALINPTIQAQVAAEGLGLGWNAAAVKAKGLETVLWEMYVATGGNEQQMVQLLGTTDAFKGAMALVGPQTENFKDRLNSMGAAAGSTGAAFATMFAEVTGKIGEIQTSLQILGIAIGTPLLQSYGNIADAIRAVINAASDEVTDGALKWLPEFLQGIFRDIEVQAALLAKNIPLALQSMDFSHFQQGLNAVYEAIKTAFTGLDLTSPEALRAGLERVGNAFMALSEYTAGYIERFAGFAKQIFAFLEGTGQLDGEFANLLGNIGAIITILDKGLPAFDNLLTVLMLIGGAAVLGKLTAGLVALGTLLGPATPILLGAAALAGIFYGSAGLIEAVKKFTDRVDESGRVWNPIFDRLVQNTSAVSDAFQRQTEEHAASLAQMEADSKAFWQKHQEAMSNIAGGDGTPSTILDIELNLDAIQAQFEALGLIYDRVTGQVRSAVDAVTEPINDMSQSFTLAKGVGQDTATVLAKDLMPALIAAGYGLGDVVEVGDGFVRVQRDGVTQMLAFDRTLGKVTETAAAHTRTAEEINAVLEKHGFALSDVSSVNENYVTVLKDGKQHLLAFSSSNKGVSDSLKDVQKDSENFRLEWEKIQSAERQTIFKATVDFQIEKLKADVAIFESSTKRIEAAFNAVTETFRSTGETLVGLWGILSGGDLSMSEKWDLQRELEKESKRRDKALELQEKMIDEQVKNMEAERRLMEARLQKINNGDALITINGDGLQPHLEGFMWEVLRMIQMRVNEDGLDMLLGWEG